MSAERKTVIVGRSKPLLNYVTACITMFNSGAELVVLRARGEAGRSRSRHLQVSLSLNFKVLSSCCRFRTWFDSQGCRREPVSRFHVWNRGPQHRFHSREGSRGCQGAAREVSALLLH